MEVKPGYKQTDVGVIPEEWDVKPLDIGLAQEVVSAVIIPTTDRERRLPADHKWDTFDAAHRDQQVQ